MSLKTSALLSATALFAGAFGFSSPASAQATRTWVSGVGDDANPCSRTAPCKTFQGAIAKTAAGGEINCLDPGSFGMLTITKSISIICDSTTGGIRAVRTDEGYRPTAIIVNAGPSDIILLSGLDIQGEYVAGQGGILFNTGGELHVRNTNLSFLGDCAISIVGSGDVHVDNITSTYAFCGLSFGYNLGAPTTGSVNFSATNVRITNSLRAGILVGSVSPTGSVKGVVSNGVIANTLYDSWGFANHGIYAETSGGRVELAIENTVLSGHKVGAIDARGAGARILVSDSVIAHNKLGVSTQGGGAVISNGGNILADNITNGSFTGTSAKR
jgi:hypothetical protein